MSKIWIVNGTSGDYDDRYDWPVGAFLEEKKAYEWCKSANELLKTFKLHMNEFCGLKQEERQYFEQEFKKMDPSINLSYTGVEYYISFVDLNPPMPSL